MPLWDCFLLVRLRGKKKTHVDIPTQQKAPFNLRLLHFIAFLDRSIHFGCEYEVMKDLRFLRFVITSAQILCFSLHVYKILDLNS